MTEPKMPGKDPALPPTPSLGEYEFEDYTEALLSAHRFCSDDIVHVQDVERWGRRGDKQDGIDLKGTLSDGISAAWQCKRQDKLTPANVSDAVEATTYKADKYFLVYSGQASTEARKQIEKHPNWQLLDQRGLARMLDDVPRARRRELLDKAFTRDIRRAVLAIPGEDAFWTVETFQDDRHNPDLVLNDISPLVGRATEVETLKNALDRSSDEYPIVITVAGPGGRGKSRLVTDVLAEHQDAHRDMPVVCLAPGNTFDQDAISDLPHGPAVVFIDDAHHNPVALGSLLTYARQTPGTQVVLATRPSAAAAIQAAVTNARFGPGDRAIIEVAELTIKEARQLVTQLTDGLNLNTSARHYLAEEATHSPDLAVITANLLRRGELTGALPLDEGLRTQVLGRYQDLRTASIENYDHDTVRRVLATYTALRPDLTNQDLTAAIAKFCGLTTTRVLRLNQQLADHGLITTTGNSTRVVPDLLADTFLEDEAAAGPIDLGFTAELWGAFGTTHRERLITALSELDWRLRHRGGPDIMAPVWNAIDTRLASGNPASIVRELDLLRNVSFTQPAQLVERLEKLRHHLNTDPPEPPTDPESDDIDEDENMRLLLGLAPHHADDVRYALPRLYTNAARADRELIETVLDAMWDLRRRDPRPPNSNPSSAARLIVDELANLNRIRTNLANTVIDRVEAWLEEPAQSDDVTTPLFALESLMAKEGQHLHAKTRWQWVMQPYAINPVAVAGIRGRIRDIIVRVALGEDPRRARDAIALLKSAIRQPHGYFGDAPEIGTIRGWDTDSEALVDAARAIAEATNEPLVRRLIRDTVGWQADHGSSPRVRHKALVLVTDLDNIDTLDENLAENIIHPVYGSFSPSRRGITPPTLEEFEADLAAGTTKPDTRARVEARRKASETELNDLAAQLLELGDDHLVNKLAETLQRATTARAKDHPTVGHIISAVADIAPTRIAGLIDAITTEPSPLDLDLEHLITAWRRHDPDAATAWIQCAAQYRPAVRRAIAEGFSREWTLAPELESVFRAGIIDPDDDVRTQFLQNSGPFIASDPEHAPAALLEAGIVSSSALTALERAGGYEGHSWGATLAEPAAVAVLTLVNHASHSGRDHALSDIMAGIATNHPELVLEHLTRTENVPADDNSSAIATAFRTHANVLARWLNNAATTGRFVAPAAGVALSYSIDENQAAALTVKLKDLDADGLRMFVDNLSSVDEWPNDQPAFTEAVYAHARTHDTLPDTRASIRSNMTPTVWGGTNGESEDLVRALTHLKKAIANATDVDLLVDYGDARAWLEQNIEADARLHQEDLDNDF
ncbi:restriction endonuclease [Nocardioides bruguierae]|uniref:Restriction endonuclease n=1 Tax=Nocardioides bruguierae TaxID=2945102 RepID=A0A9X2D4Z8_9ACTN|nr:restriction endonuclease [Nocardioides bruguierae]MCM0619527.1 restriction endonuclease [Nocardioides bruguierae]